MKTWPHCPSNDLFVNMFFAIKLTYRKLYFCDPYHLTRNLKYMKKHFRHFENMTLVWPLEGRGPFTQIFVKIFSDQMWLWNYQSPSIVLRWPLVLFPLQSSNASDALVSKFKTGKTKTGVRWHEESNDQNNLFVAILIIEMIFCFNAWFD